MTFRLRLTLYSLFLFFVMVLIAYGVTSDILIFALAPSFIIFRPEMVEWKKRAKEKE